MNEEILTCSYLIGGHLKKEPKLHNENLINKFGEDLVYSIFGYLLLTIFLGDLDDEEYN